MTYHDFDYVGYQTRTQLKSSDRSNRFQSLGQNSPRNQRQQKSKGTIMSPRIVSGVTRSDNHGTRRVPIMSGNRSMPKKVTGIGQKALRQPKAILPEIVKRGPINLNNRHPKKIVGLSLQKKDDPPAKYVNRSKRGSLEPTQKSHRNSKARNALLKAQHLEVPYPKQKPVSRAAHGQYRMPNRQSGT